MKNHSTILLRRRWHVWVVAVAIFLLYIGGAEDFLRITLGDEVYIRNQFGEGGIAYFSSYPLVLWLVWLLNVSCGLLAPILLLLRRRASVLVAGVAAVSQIVLIITTFEFRNRWELLGPDTAWFDIGIGIVTTLFACYCWIVMYRRH